uniref:Uncharacterized protein n=1 Tax=Rhizophora mucronata TaxID=61149 RepID=A0A2P2QV35_RHIMU
MCLFYRLHLPSWKYLLEILCLLCLCEWRHVNSFSCNDCNL